MSIFIIMNINVLIVFENATILTAIHYECVYESYISVPSLDARDQQWRKVAKSGGANILKSKYIYGKKLKSYVAIASYSTLKIRWG